MAIGSDEAIELLKCRMIIHESIFKDQVRELHRLYQAQKSLMTEVKLKDMNLLTLTSANFSEYLPECSRVNLSREYENKAHGSLGFWFASKDDENQQASTYGFHDLQSTRFPLLNKSGATGMDLSEAKQYMLGFHNAKLTCQGFDFQQRAVNCANNGYAHIKNADKATESLLDDNKDLQEDLQLTLNVECTKPRVDSIKGGFCRKLESTQHVTEKMEYKDTRIHKDALLFSSSYQNNLQMSNWQQESAPVFRQDQCKIVNACSSKENFSVAISRQQNSTLASALPKKYLVSPRYSSLKSCIYDASSGDGRLCDNFQNGSYQFSHEKCCKKENIPEKCMMFRQSQKFEGVVNIQCNKATQSESNKHQYMRDEYSLYHPESYVFHAKELLGMNLSEAKRNHQMSADSLSPCSSYSPVSDQRNLQWKNGKASSPVSLMHLPLSQTVNIEDKAERRLDLTLGLSREYDNKRIYDVPCCSSLTDMEMDSGSETTFSPTMDTQTGKQRYLQDKVLLHEARNRMQKNSSGFMGSLKVLPESMLERIINRADMSTFTELISAAGTVSDATHEDQKAALNLLGTLDKFEDSSIRMQETIHMTTRYEEKLHDNNKPLVEHTDIRVETFKTNIDSAYQHQKEIHNDASRQICLNEDNLLINAKTPPQEEINMLTFKNYREKFTKKAFSRSNIERNVGDLSLRTEFSLEGLKSTIDQDCSFHDPASESIVATESVSNSNQQKSSDSKFFCMPSKGQNELMESSVSHITDTEYTRPHGLCLRSTCTDKRLLESQDTHNTANILSSIRSERVSVLSTGILLKPDPAQNTEEALYWFADIAVADSNFFEPTCHTVIKETDSNSSSLKCDGNEKELDIFADTSKISECSSLKSSNDLDYFESMTLMLPEIVTDSQTEELPRQGKDNDNNFSEICTPGASNGRAKRKRDFRRELLPSISSLSRQEIAEDMNTFEGLLRSMGHVGSLRRRTSSIKNACFVSWDHLSDYCVGESISRTMNTRKVNNGHRPLAWADSGGEAIKKRRVKKTRGSPPSVSANPQIHLNLI